MQTSTTKLIAILATAASLLATSAAMAKGPSKGGGGNNGGSRRGSSRMSSMSKHSSNSFKLSGNNNSKNHSISSSMSSKKGITLSQTFKKQDLNKNLNKNGNGLGIALGNNSKFDKKFDKKFDPKFDKKFDNYSKDFFFKKNNKFWFDPWYSKKNCYPYYFGCYYPTYSCYSPSFCYYPLYSCYNYCTPTYTSLNYSNYSGSLTVSQTVAPSRTQVPVGSVLLVNGQAFGDKAGGARLRLSGMAMPIEVLEWTATGVKVRLPQLEITGNTPAEIEVLRGDGSLASKTAVELTASSEQLALGR